LRARSRAGSRAVLTGLLLATWGTVALPVQPAAPSHHAATGRSAPLGCTPIGGGTDNLPLTLTLVINDGGFAEPFVARASTAGQPDAVVQRDPEIGGTIETEITQLQATGFHPRTSDLTVRRSTAQPTLGQIGNIEQNGACQLVGADAFFDLYLELDVQSVGETWVNLDPIRVTARLGALPPENVRFEVAAPLSVTLHEQSTSQARGVVLYALLHTDPPFPPAAADCFDSVFTGQLNLTGVGTSSLFGFGLTRIERSDPLPSGFCVVGGAPCDSNLDCGLSTCVKASINTELAELRDLIGSAPLLGQWEMRVLPAGGTSDCCQSHAGGGCSDPACEALICSQDSFCCTVQWDALCASLAESEPTCAAGCPNPNANPTYGQVTSQTAARTYPASASFNLFIEIETALHGTVHNGPQIPVSAPTIRNTPPDPETAYAYGGAPIAMLYENGSSAGTLSSVVHTLQPPKDCDPPPGPAADCLDAALRLTVVLPGCPAASLELLGPMRALRDEAVEDPPFSGQDRAAAVLAKAVFVGSSPCAGPLTARVVSADGVADRVASLTPEEFFPARALFDAVIEIDVGASTLHTDGPVPLETTVNVLPLEPGEEFAGPTGSVDLLDAGDLPVGQVADLVLEVLDPGSCPPGSAASIQFTGPTKDDFSTAIPQGGGGVDYDVLRGMLDDLRSTGGSLASATCMAFNAGPSHLDTETPPAGTAFYYVARDGLGVLDTTWNGSGLAQQGDRDATAPSCP
jgi:hypothetical protein